MAQKGTDGPRNLEASTSRFVSSSVAIHAVGFENDS